MQSQKHVDSVACRWVRSRRPVEAGYIEGSLAVRWIGERADSLRRFRDSCLARKWVLSVGGRLMAGREGRRAERLCGLRSRRPFVRQMIGSPRGSRVVVTFLRLRRTKYAHCIEPVSDPLRRNERKISTAAADRRQPAFNSFSLIPMRLGHPVYPQTSCLHPT